MKKRLKKIYKSKFFKFIVVPILLLVLWLFLTCAYILTYDKSLTVISYLHNKENISRINEKILKDDIVSGEFIANENNLGIISVKFELFDRPLFKNEDTILFRIKEKGTREWYHQNSYKNGLMYEVPVFPFGFPIISDSKGKAYYFEIQSLNGNKNNAIAISNTGQVFFSKYYITKQSLLQNDREFTSYIVRKFISSLMSTDLKFSSFIYLLPFIFYLILISPLGKHLMNLAFRKKYKLLLPLLLIILIDIFMVQLTNDIAYVIIGFLWIITLKLSKQNTYITYLLVIFLIILSPIFLFIKEPQIAEKAAVWGYMMLIFAVIQSIIEYKFTKKNDNVVKNE